MNAAYRIPECNLDELKNKVRDLNKVATKLHLEPLQVTETGEEFKQILRCRKYDHTGCLHGWKPVGPYDPDFKTVRFVLVELNGADPVLEGWHFLATVTHEETGNTIRRVPDTDELTIPESYRTSAPKCDHCQTKRARKDTYLVYRVTDDGPFELKEVGHQCVADFLGHFDPHTIAKFLESLSALERFCTERDDDDIVGRSHSEEFLLTDEYLGHVAAIIRTNGWLSGARARERGLQSTAGKAHQNWDWTVHPNHRPSSRFGGTTNPESVTEADGALAAATLAWAASELRDKEVKTDYEHNLAVTLGKQYLTHRDLGTAASGIITYKRANDLLEQKKAATPKVESQWVGEVGKRADFVLTVDRSTEHPGFMPREVTNVIAFHDQDGNKFVWFATGRQGLRVGETYIVKGTVKAHNENDRFGKQTVLNRCKVVEAVAAPVIEPVQEKVLATCGV